MPTWRGVQSTVSTNCSTVRCSYRVQYPSEFMALSLWRVPFSTALCPTRGRSSGECLGSVGASRSGGEVSALRARSVSCAGACRPLGLQASRRFRFVHTDSLLSDPFGC